jgi:membrane protein YqaA with SNARE-associated domain
VETAIIFASLFIVSFGAATILPLQSELMVVPLLLSGKHPWQMVILVASIGNILGSMMNWLLGRFLLRFQDRRWFPASRTGLARAENWYRRYGRASLLLSWLPIVGDPLTVVAGMLREPIWSFTALVSIAKIGRYLALTALTLGAFG